MRDGPEATGIYGPIAGLKPTPQWTPGRTRGGRHIQRSCTEHSHLAAIYIAAFQIAVSYTALQSAAIHTSAARSHTLWGCAQRMALYALYAPAVRSIVSK